ncbi:MAG TPA: glycoside hydrolase family 3 C-terminal domain-containing protein [Rhodanobacteraceae bacterium]
MMLNHTVSHGRPGHRNGRVCVPLLLILGAALAGCASHGKAPVAAASASAPVASAHADASCPWVDSREPTAKRVSQLMARMSLQDKIALVHGGASGPYSGEVAGNKVLCIPALTLNDGPIGVRMGDTTQLPSGTDLAATFDPALARAYGAVIGAEDRTKGVDVDLGPTINIVRDPRWGRAFESYSEDPLLAGRIAAGDVEGVQSQGVLAQVKHWAIYNQEAHRNTPQDDVIVSHRAIHELYTRAFDTVVQTAHPSSVMCSYAWVNGVNACEDGYMNRILEKGFGFDGFITSDWGGTHSTVAAANAGLDMEMPDAKYFGNALAAAVKAGKVSQQRLDDMVRRILTQEFRFGLFDRHATGNADAVASTPAHVHVALQVAEQGAVLLKNAHHVLPLTRSDRTISLIGDGAGFDTLTHGGGSASVAGTGTVTPRAGITARAVRDGAVVTFAQGSRGADSSYPTIPQARFTPPGGDGHGLQVQYFAGTDLAGSPIATAAAVDVSKVWHGAPVKGITAKQGFSVRWTGTLTPTATGTYTFGLTSQGGSRLLIDGKQVIDAWNVPAAHLEEKDAAARIEAGLPVPLGHTLAARVHLTAGTPVKIEVDYFHKPSGKASIWWMEMGTTHLSDAFVNLGWAPPGQALTVADAARVAAKASVAIVYANKFESEAFDEKDIDLSDSQNALIEAVAAANPNTIVVLNTGSAVTMPWLDKVAGVVEAWYPGQQAGNAIAALLYGDVDPSGKLPVTFPKSLGQVPASTPAEWGGVDGKVHYSEGLDVGYRWYDAKHLTPLFPFGFGLSYTTFRLSDLHVSPTLAAGGSVDVSARIENTGKRTGADVVQVYLGAPAAADEPPLQLVGFDKVSLQPGESRTAHIAVSAHAASRWDTQTHAWVLTPGTYTLRVGDSSRHLPLAGHFAVHP